MVATAQRVPVALLVLHVVFNSVAGAGDRTESAAVGVERPSKSNKAQSVEASILQLAKLGIVVRYDRSAVEHALAASGGRLEARPLEDVDFIYGAIYHLTDLSRLPAATYPLVRNLLLMDRLRMRDARSGKLRDTALAYEMHDKTIVIDHSNVNQLELFGTYMHPKVNFAMILELAVEARLRSMGSDTLDALGLKLVVDDDEWVQLNGPGSGGWGAYTGESLSFIGFGAALRVTPPGIIYDAVHEVSTGVPSDAYAGFPDVSHPWWSPRHSPAVERQSLLRCMFSRSDGFFLRLEGGPGVRSDVILREKARLILYAAFVASGGALDQSYWRRRHPNRAIVAQLTRDFDSDLLRQLNRRLAQNPKTHGQRIARPE